MLKLDKEGLTLFQFLFFNFKTTFHDNDLILLS